MTSILIQPTNQELLQQLSCTETPRLSQPSTIGAEHNRTAANQLLPPPSNCRTLQPQAIPRTTSKSVATGDKEKSTSRPSLQKKPGISADVVLTESPTKQGEQLPARSSPSEATQSKDQQQSEAQLIEALLSLDSDSSSLSRNVNVQGFEEMRAWQRVAPYCVYIKKTEKPKMKPRKIQPQKLNGVVYKHPSSPYHEAAPSIYQDYQREFSLSLHFRDHQDFTNARDDMTEGEASVFWPSQPSHLISCNILSYKMPSWRLLVDLRTMQYRKRVHPRNALAQFQQERENEGASLSNSDDDSGRESTESCKSLDRRMNEPYWQDPKKKEKEPTKFCDPSSSIDLQLMRFFNETRHYETTPLRDLICSMIKHGVKNAAITQGQEAVVLAAASQVDKKYSHVPVTSLKISGPPQAKQAKKQETFDRYIPGEEWIVNNTGLQIPDVNTVTNGNTVTASGRKKSTADRNHSIKNTQGDESSPQLIVDTSGQPTSEKKLTKKQTTSLAINTNQRPSSNNALRRYETKYFGEVASSAPPFPGHKLRGGNMRQYGHTTRARSFGDPPSSNNNQGSKSTGQDLDILSDMRKRLSVGKTTAITLRSTEPSVATAATGFQPLKQFNAGGEIDGTEALLAQASERLSKLRGSNKKLTSKERLRIEREAEEAKINLPTLRYGNYIENYMAGSKSGSSPLTKQVAGSREKFSLPPIFGEQMNLKNTDTNNAIL